MKESIRQHALELGFDDCRFTTAAPPESAPHLQSWLGEERHGEMNWIERNATKRIDPHLVLPGARSVICLAASYHVSNRQSPIANRQSGEVARYARHTDYHDVLANKLKALTNFVNELGDARIVRQCDTEKPTPCTSKEGNKPANASFPVPLLGGARGASAANPKLQTSTNTRSLWYVDTGPILERDLAQRAGIGFVGKHTNLISRKLGNWIFLAEILTTLELEPDAPEKNRCGSCSRCITACPTRAITAPFQLDARLCISYLTIELKGSIPLELRPLIGNRIYGCDDCLAVCPWNKFAREGSLMKPHARHDFATPDLIELLQLDATGFKSKFTGTPMLRTKRRGVLRNVCVALGNVGDKSALPALEKACGDSEPLIAEHAHWAVEQIASRCEQR